MIEPMAPAPRMAKSKSGMGGALQRLGDVQHEPAVLGFGLRRVALQYPPVAADEEFLEVPADVAGDAPVLGGEEAVERMAVGAVHLEFRAQREAHVVVAAAEGGDLRFAARFLRGELVAWETHHGEVLLPQLTLQLLEPGILGRQAAATGDIHRQSYLATQPSQQVLAAVYPTYRNVVKAAHDVCSVLIRVYVRYTRASLNIGAHAFAEILMASELSSADTTRVVATLNRILELEDAVRSEEHTSELQSPCNLVCRLLLEKKKN